MCLLSLLPEAPTKRIGLSPLLRDLEAEVVAPDAEWQKRKENVI